MLLLFPSKAHARSKGNIKKAKVKKENQSLLHFCLFTFSVKKSARRWLKTPGGKSQEESNVTLPLFPL
jgi:hypothetical protein